jgi:hypothetical protein
MVTALQRRNAQLSAGREFVRRLHSLASIAPSTSAEQSTHNSTSVFDSTSVGRFSSSFTATTKRAGRFGPLRWQSSHLTQSGARVKDRRFLNIG